MDPRTQAMAAVIVNYSIGVRKGDWVIIQTPLPGKPMAHALVDEVLAAGGYPNVIFSSEDIQESLLRKGTDEQLQFLATSPLTKTFAEGADARISIIAPENTRALTEIHPSRMTVYSRAAQPLLETFMKRSASGEMRWSVAAYPTQAGAQDAGMSLRAYEDFVYEAGLVLEPDPVAAWQRLGERQQRLIDWLAGKKTVHISAPGTDLTLSVEGRTWVNDTGHENFPGGEIFTGPVEDSADGTIRFSYPAFNGGREVPGVRLVFRKGVVVEASASADDAYLQEMLDLDEGARRLGEFAFGTNPGITRFTKNTLFDEKIGGTLHMALGRSYEETGGTNQSALHWDMVCNLREESEVTVDGELFSRNGAFAV